MDITKRLIFHMWIPPKGSTQYELPENLHFACLKRFSNVFTEALFILSTDDVNDSDTLSLYKSRILSCGFNRNVTFKVIENTMYYESLTFYNEIASKLSELDGLTFFGHSKGLTNYHGNEENTIYWVLASYYFNLNWMDEVERMLLSYQQYYYGTLLSLVDTIPNRYKWYYAGTFMWINTRKLNEYGVKYDGAVVPPLVDRSYSELFPGNMTDRYPVAGSHGFKFYCYGNDYNAAKERALGLCDESEVEGFETFVRDMTSEAGIAL